MMSEFVSMSSLVVRVLALFRKVSDMWLNMRWIILLNWRVIYSAKVSQRPYVLAVFWPIADLADFDTFWHVTYSDP